MRVEQPLAVHVQRVGGVIGQGRCRLSAHQDPRQNNSEREQYLFHMMIETWEECREREICAVVDGRELEEA